MAIKVLEDREITNAGYGSNLALDGQVEGDAIVVDHNGRSGGVGAISRGISVPYLKTKLTSVRRRGKESHLGRKKGPRGHHSTSEPAPRPSESHRWSRSH